MASQLNKVGVIGPPGSGKSYLARILGAELRIPVTELDSVFWLPGWRRREKDEFVGVRPAASSN